MKTFYKMIAITFLGIVISFTVLHFSMSDSDYSAAEKRNLKGFPTISAERIFNGEFEEDWETYLEDQFPFRSVFMKTKTSISSFLGQKKSNGIYLLENDSLAEEFIQPEEEKMNSQIQAVNDFYKQNKNGDTEFLFLLSPTAMGEAEYKNALPPYVKTDSELAYIDRYFEKLDSGIKVYDTRELFTKGEDRNFYLTDHHWTGELVFKVYQGLLSVLGKEDSSKWTKQILSDDFSGSLSAKSGFSIGKDRISIYTNENVVPYVVSYPLENRKCASLYVPEALDQEDPYQVFFGGNYPLIEIETGAETDETLLVIKDSFANSLVPYFISHYRKIIIVDPRYYYEDLNALMVENFDTVLFCYNANTLSSDTSLELILNGEEK